MQNLFTSQSLAGMTYYVLCMTTKKWREIPARNLQLRLQTSDNTPESAECATVRATGCRARVRPLLSYVRHQSAWIRSRDL